MKNLGKTLFIIWLVCFTSALTYATWHDVIVPVFEKMFWQLADKMSKGVLHSVNIRLERHLNAFGNYQAMCDQFFAKQYPFTEDGFHEYIKDRKNILNSQNQFLWIIRDISKSYKESMIDEHGWGDK